MPMEPGTQLGPYRVVAPIGAGGMGEVYKAKDTRLDRTVAIKVMPEHLAESPERKQRFEREAKAISQLNHPHICTLHDIGHENGIDYIIMEYLEGDSLADRLKRGPLPFEEALMYGQQIADGLGKAHRHGVVHRDLKPGNVILTRSGAKVLDFGLAKLRTGGPVSADSDGSSLSTQDKPLTDAQTILGTIQYMAPEQLEGKETDARSDIFAFGALLYEMVTGKKAFEGESQASLIAAILEKEPLPISKLQPLSPTALDRVVRTCLAKDPDNRWQNVEDVGRQLAWLGQSQPESAAPAKSHSTLLVGVLAALLAAGIAWLVKPAAEPSPSPIRFTLDLPSSPLVVSTTTGEAFESNLAISPDGRTLVFSTEEDTRRLLRERRLDRFGSRILPGTEDAGAPFFSPDGEWVAFFTGGQLRKVRLDGGEPTTICNCQGLGGSWSAKGEIVYTASDRSGLFRVSEDGGESERLTEVDESTEYWHFAPHVLPDGEHVLFSTFQVDNAVLLEILSLRAKQRRSLALDIPIALHPSYVRGGHVVFNSAAGLTAVPFDLSRHEPTGPPVTVVEEVFADAGLAFSQYAVSENGTLFYIPGLGDRRLLWVDRDGRATPVTPETRPYFIPRLSPDGTRVALVIFDATGSQRHIWTLDIERGTLTRLTFGEGHSTDPVWSPDGERIAFASNRSGLWSHYWKSADGSGDAVELTPERTTVPTMASSWSPDGQWLFFKRGGATNFDIGMLRVEGAPETKLILDSPFEELFPSLSPDGDYLAYTSNETGRREVYVRAFPELTGKQQISSEGGSEPVWSEDGTELFYREGRKLVRVEVETRPEFTAGQPETLFQGNYQVDPFGGDMTNYDVSADGERFLMVAGAAETQELNVVVHWSEELKRRVPTDN